MYDRDAIIAIVDLRALADELLGPHAGGERNPAWICPNPQHSQTGRTPPVSIFTSHRGEPRWRCHGCGDGGTAIDLVMACRGIDAGSAIQELAVRVHEVPQPPSWDAPPRLRALHVAGQSRARDPEGLHAYVTECASALWRPEGAAIRRWLTEERGLPEAVLRANQLGADLGPGRQNRPDGIWRTGGAVLPVIAEGRATYAQVRVPHPRPNRPRYLNPSADLAPNPRIARFRPSSVQHPEVIITEGSIDALSATAAGYRAIAVLSAGYPDQSVAHAIAQVPHPLVIAFDPDNAGSEGARRLAGLLTAELRPSVTLDLGDGDLNDALTRSDDWNGQLADQVARATQAQKRSVQSLNR